jgi:hypothetical protein
MCLDGSAKQALSWRMNKHEESASEVSEGLAEPLHSVRIRLYPNHLPSAEGDLLARVENETVLSMKDIIANLIRRTGFPGNPGEMLRVCEAVAGEIEYSLLDGYAVDTGLAVYSVHVGGNWKSALEIDDRTKHPVSFKVRIKERVRRLACLITLKASGRDTTQGAIYTATWEANPESAAAGFHILDIRGAGLKIAGNPELRDAAAASGEPYTPAGVYLAGEDGAETSAYIATNHWKHLRVVVPADSISGPCRLRIITYTTAGYGTNLLAAPRLVEYDNLVQFTTLT